MSVSKQTGDVFDAILNAPPKMMPEDVQTYAVRTIPLEGEMVEERSSGGHRMMPAQKKTNWGALVGSSLIVLLIAVIAGLLVKFPQAGQEALSIVKQLVTPDKQLQASVDTPNYNDAVLQEQLDLLLETDGAKSSSKSKLVAKTRSALQSAITKR